MEPSDRYYDAVDEVVDDGYECPECGEARTDYLVWDADGETVKCATCGKEYNPSEVADETL